MSGVIHIITQLERGGAQRNTLETAAALHHTGRPQWLWTGEPGELDEEAARRLGSRFQRVHHLVHAARPAQDARALVELTTRLSRAVAQLRPPVIVHTHSTKAGVLGRLAASAVRGVVVMHTVHGFGFEALGARRRWVVEGAERVAGRATDVAVFVSEADAREAQALGLFPRARTEVIRSGIDPARFAATRNADTQRAARALFGLAPDAPVAVCVANFKPQKDPLFHVEVLAAWRKLERRAALLFLGDGPLRAQTLARADALGLQDAFVAPGFLEDPAPAYLAADAALLCSAWEGLPRSILETSAAGLWGVVRDSGWASDIAWATHVAALPADALPPAFAGPLTRAVAATRSQKRVVRVPRDFTLTGMLESLERLYDDLVGPPAPTDAERRAMRRRPSRNRRR
jgi:glycosyltransferase involved in cell wall biosynthesis